MAGEPAKESAPEEKAENVPMPEASFLTLVAGLATQVLMNLGEIANPLNGEKARDLEHAKFTIDLLGVIQEKTRGNLTAQEQEFLELTLYDLRLKYVSASGY
jgi:hypothetical protein